MGMTQIRQRIIIKKLKEILVAGFIRVKRKMLLVVLILLRSFIMPFP